MRGKLTNMEVETVTFTKTVKIEDVHGEPIREGSVLKHTDGGEEGVVTKIYREGDRSRWGIECVGDMQIKTSSFSTRISNNYSKWRHIPHEEQTYHQRYQSWCITRKFVSDSHEEEEDDVAISGIMNLLPMEIVDWENGPWPDSLGDALYFLQLHLTNLTEKEK
jgi:hypothetical protein